MVSLGDIGCTIPPLVYAYVAKSTCNPVW